MKDVQLLTFCRPQTTEYVSIPALLFKSLFDYNDWWTVIGASNCNYLELVTGFQFEKDEFTRLESVRPDCPTGWLAVPRHTVGSGYIGCRVYKNESDAVEAMKYYNGTVRQIQFSTDHAGFYDYRSPPQQNADKNTDKNTELRLPRIMWDILKGKPWS
jgi:hypothetical protein